MDLNEVRNIRGCSDVTFIARRLRLPDGPAVQTFSWFACHAYDEATIHKVLVRSEAKDDLLLGLFDGSRMIGYFFLWYFDRPVPLLGIALQPEYQGKGLGKALIELLVTEAFVAGRDGIELTTGLDNHRAFALYEKIGFSHWGDVENVLGDGTIVTERAMYYPIKPGSQPPKGSRHAPPV